MAAVDYFLKLDGIEGESQDSKHKGLIDLESFSWGVTQSGDYSTRGGGGAGKAVFQDFHFTMKINKASPKLFLACAEGTHIKSGQLISRKAGGKQEEYLKVTFSDLLVSSFQTGGSAHGDVVPTEQISINFAKLEIEYKEQKADGTLGGTVKTGYDIKQNKKV
jgi:type VI secretion system secreted protein Hcp